jgi:hypothetical protein
MIPDQDQAGYCTRTPETANKGKRMRKTGRPQKFKKIKIKIKQ